MLCSNSAYIVEVDTGNIIELLPMNTSRKWHPIAWINGFPAVIGGNDGKKSIDCVEIKQPIISSDSKYIVSVHNDACLNIWNIQDKALEAVFEGYSYNISYIEISNGSKYIVSAYYSFTIRIWNF